MSALPMTKLLPKTIGRYEIRRELGRGMMGVVYEAYDPDLARRIALKTILLAFAPAPEDRKAFEQRFFAEARAAARLSHPGIVIVHDVGRDAETGTLYIALEYLEGRTLADLINDETPVEWREALRIVRRVAEALHCAHAQHVIHRDIKPANIMLLPSGEPKIMDFGIAKIETARLQLTAAGQFFGTPVYMAPEQALGHQFVDGRVDLFSLGAVSYSLLTGQLAFAGETIPTIVRQVITQDPPPPSSIVPGLPAEVDYFVARALAKAPDDRYPHGQAMAEDIEDILASRPPRHRSGWKAPRRAEGTMLSVADKASPAPPKRHPTVPDLADLDLEAAFDSLVADRATAPQAERVATDSRSAARRAEPSGRADASAAAPPRAVHRDRGQRAESQSALPRGLVFAVGLAAAAIVLLLVVRGGKEPVPSPAPRALATASPLMAVPTRRPSADESRLSRDASPSAAALTPTSIASDEAAPAQNAQVAIDFTHGLKSGRLRVWVDDGLRLDEQLDSRVTQKVLLLEKRKGDVEETLGVAPGKHEIKVQVKWDDNVRTERISGNFKPGSTRRLAAKVGGLIKKNLSLEWE